MFPLREFLGFEIETGGGSGLITVEMHTRFHRPAATGRLTTTATVLTTGRRIAHVEAKTHDDQGRLVASATSSFAIISG